jgi:Zn-dependent protease
VEEWVIEKRARWGWTGALLASGIGGITGSTLLSLVSGQVSLYVPRPIQIVLMVVVLYFAIVVHEVSHGFVANLRGDPTAKRLGRLTLNPIPHIDIFGSIIIPGFLILTNAGFVIGWAKPVPIDIRRFRDPLGDFAITSLAGPASNVIQGLIYVGLFHAASAFASPGWVLFLAYIGALINFILAIFNMIPIPPLDGSRLVAALLPTDLAVQYLSIERFGFIIIFGLLWLGAFRVVFGAAQDILHALLG